MTLKSKTEAKSDKDEQKFVQDYIPIIDVINGIIKTADGRYIKILEIEPINFSLRSSEEQYNIISDFASWLKIAPVRLQFKSITKKADSEKYLRNLKEDMKGETNQNCLSLAEDYINLIQTVGSREALTRRFFLLFEYEGAHKSDADDFSTVYSTLSTVEHTARQYFARCGNSIVRWNDPNTAVTKILFMFFNRNTYEDDTFQKRINRVVTDAMKSKGLKLGTDEIPKIRFNNYICPRGIDFTHKDYFVMDGMYFSIIGVKENGYPDRVRAGWIAQFVNAGEGVDVDIFVRREDRAKAVDKVAQKIRLNTAKMKEKNDSMSDYEELYGSIQSGYYIKQSIANNNEDLFYMSILVTLSAKTLSNLQWKKQQFINMLKASDFAATQFTFQQEAAFRSVLPLVHLDESLKKKTQRNVLTSGLASTYMFTSFELSDDNGVLLGINNYNSSLCIVDLFNTKKNKNANLNLLGTSGAGKTFTLQLLALRMRMRGIQCFILAPTKGHEFRRACNAIGGTYVKIAPGSQSCINVMEIRHTISPDMELIDEEDFNNLSMLSKKIQQLMVFFTLLIPDITNEEEQLLDEALVATYADFGITHDNDSLYIDKEATPPVMKKMPIIGDLHERIKKIPRLERVAIILGTFVTGSAQSFNQQTNVDLTNKYVVLDLTDLTGKLLPVGMMIALDYIWDVVQSDRSKKKAILIDEIWKLIGTSANKQAADFCLNIFKTIRGFGGAAISATQDISDFFALEDGKFGRAIINNSKTKIVLNLELDEAKYVQDVLKLTKNEVSAITRFETGNAFVFSGSSKVPVQIKASPKEHSLITTDRAELEALVRQKKNEKTMQDFKSSTSAPVEQKSENGSDTAKKQQQYSTDSTSAPLEQKSENTGNLLDEVDYEKRNQ